jgi:hypothetical protein
VTRHLKFAAIVLILYVATAPREAKAMPNFARKLNAPCSLCHTTIPRLNETGYKFRAAGFRMPNMIGTSEDQKFELGDYFAARLQARYDTQVTNQPNSAPVANVINNVAGPRTTTNALSFQEFTLYPLTGSWGKYFGSLSELSVSPEDVFEIENAYVRFVSLVPKLLGLHPSTGQSAPETARSCSLPLPIGPAYRLGPQHEAKACLYRCQLPARPHPVPTTGKHRGFHDHGCQGQLMTIGKPSRTGGAP